MNSVNDDTSTTVDTTTAVVKTKTVKPINTHDVTYSFYRVQHTSTKKDTNGFVCVAILPSKNAKKFKVGLSFCSPADSLNKRRGRSIALGRLTSDRKGRNFTVNFDASSYADNSFMAEVCQLAILKSLKTKTEKGGKNYRLIGGVKKPLWYAPDWLRNLDSDITLKQYSGKKNIKKAKRKPAAVKQAVAA